MMIVVLPRPAVLAPIMLAVLAILMVGQPALGKVVRLEVLRRGAFAEGAAFGQTGPYEVITGRLHYAVDPDDPANVRVVDLALAPRDARGQVTFAGDFVLLKPVDPSRGNNRLLYDVNNRGNLVALATLNDAPWSNRPTSRRDAGNGFLMEQGYTLLWSAWNGDVLAGGERLQITLPVATKDGRSITGPVAAEMVASRPAATIPVVWGRSRGYSPAIPDDPQARLTVRDMPDGARRPIPRGDWRFVAPKSKASVPLKIVLGGGFKPGRLYELVYDAKDPWITGLGLTAIRDALSFFRHAGSDDDGHANSLALGPKEAFDAVIVFGVSQSGRVIQHMLWEGFHVDEAGRPVFDAALIHVAGAGKGAFNHRFAQTTRHPSQWEDHLYPVDVFPFATTPQRDPQTGEEGSVLDRARAIGALPRLFYTGTSTEYWTRAASLLHVDVTGGRDLPLDPNVRVYSFAGAHHGSGVWAQRPDFINCGNPLDHRPALRALLAALDRWATEDVAPPPSAYPRIADGTLGTVDAYRRAFPSLPAQRLPDGNLQPPRLDLGPRFARAGIADHQPARRGAPFVTLVPLPDDDGNDRGGIRLPAVAVPLGAYLGWNRRSHPLGPPSRLGRWEGSFLPFAATEAARDRLGDPRPSLDERYETRNGFLEQTRAAADRLEERRLLMPRDVAAIVARAGRAYDAVAERGDTHSCAYLDAW